MLPNLSLVSCSKLLIYFPFIKKLQTSAHTQWRNRNKFHPSTQSNKKLKTYETMTCKALISGNKRQWSLEMGNNEMSPMTFLSFQTIVQEGRNQVEIGDSLSWGDETDHLEKTKHLEFSGKSSKGRNFKQRENHNWCVSCPL